MASAKYKNGDFDTEARNYSLLHSYGDADLLASYYASGSIDDFLNAPDRQSKSNRDGSSSDVSRSTAKASAAYDPSEYAPRSGIRDFKSNLGQLRDMGSSPSSRASSRYADAETGASPSPSPAQFSLERELLERERELLEKERLLARRDRELRERELRERDARRRVREQQRLERNKAFDQSVNMPRKDSINVSRKEPRYDNRQQVEQQRILREKQIQQQRDEAEELRQEQQRRERRERRERQRSEEKSRVEQERRYAAEQKQRLPRNTSLSQRQPAAQQGYSSEPTHLRRSSSGRPPVPLKDENEFSRPLVRAESITQPHVRSESIAQPHVRSESANQPLIRSESTTKGLARSETTTKSRKDKGDKTVPTGPIDIIDRLDVSGIYGGGSFYKHDGPYAAAMAAAASTSPAFKDEALDPMSHLKSSADDGGYGAAKSMMPSSGGSLSMLPANSSASGGLSSQQTSFTSAENGNGDRIEMGFPAGRMKQKERELAEMYGLRDLEAWEDFGTSSVEHIDMAPAASTNQVTPRAGDMESTLRSSASTRRRPLKTPTHLSNAPPPAPIDLSSVILNPGFPESESGNEDYAISGNTFRGPQRSKSIKQRLRSLSVREKPAARKNNTPFDSPAVLRANQSLPTSNDDDDEIVSPSTSLGSFHDDFLSPTRQNVQWGSLPKLGREEEKKGKGIARFLKLGKK